MLLIASWIYLLAVAWGYGKWLINQRCTNQLAACHILRLAIGLLSLAALLMVTATIAPLNCYVGLAISFPGFLYTVFNFKQLLLQNQLRILAFCSLALTVTILCKASDTDFYDTALYHQQYVNWLTQYGFVKGLALIYFRFAWPSSVFALAAPFNT